MKIYGVIHPDNEEVQFAFNAKDDNDAHSKVRAWDQHHGFTGRGASLFQELDPQSAEAMQLHNEYM